MERDFDWASWIKFERQLRGWSQNEMAARAIVSDWQSTLQRIEAKKMAVTLRTLVIVAPIFGLSPSEVMDFAFAPYAEPTTQKIVDFLEVGKIIQAKRKYLDMSEEELGLQIDLRTSRIVLLENAFPKSVKANIVISLDHALDFDGELIGITWSVIEKELVEKHQTGKIAN